MSDSMNEKLRCVFVDVHLWVCRLSPFDKSAKTCTFFSAADPDLTSTWYNNTCWDEASINLQQHSLPA